MSEYKIVVDFNGGQDGDGYKSPNANKDPKQTYEDRQAQTVLQSVFGFVQQGINGFAGLATVAGVAAVGKSIFSHEIQRVGRYTGSSQAQDVANATLSILGMIANPLGTAINLGYEMDQRQYERTWESIGLQLARERGGASINRSRQED